MADNRNVLRINAQFQKAIKEPNEYIKFAVDDDPYTWLILIHNISGNKDEYLGGEFIFRMILPKDFPYNPPEFYALTPNGLYDCHKKCCISIGEFHKDEYRAVLGASGFAKELANGLINWHEVESGMNMLRTNYEEKKGLAKSSRDYNLKFNKKFLDLIENQFKSYSKKWDRSKITDEIKRCLNL